MRLEYDVQKLEKTINSFYDAMGVSISILYEDYSVLGTKKLKNPYCHLIQSNKRGLIKCMDQNCLLLERCKSSKKPEMNICHAGLVEMAVPIIYRDDVIGYLLLGHVRCERGRDEMQAALSELPIDREAAERLYEELCVFGDDRLSAIMDVAEMFISHVMAEKLIKPHEDEDFESIRQYIFDNFDKKLTASSIAAGVHLSKSTLYNVIKRATGNTVNEYINIAKVERSKSLLLETDMSAETVAEKLGFSSAAYYSRLFKKFVGMPPSVYRKQNL